MTKQINNSIYVSDHHPSQLGNIVSWNIDYQNEKKGEDLDRVAYSIAKQIADGQAAAHMLQEVPEEQAEVLIKRANYYLQNLKPGSQIDYNYQRNDGITATKAGNLTLFVKGQPYQDIDKNPPAEIKELQQFFKNSNGQALVTPLKKPDGSVSLLINVHAKVGQGRIKLEEMFKRAQAIQKKYPHYDITIGGDFNKIQVQLQQELAQGGIDANRFNHQHSQWGSNYTYNPITKKYEERAVDAFFTLGNIASPLKRLANYNDANSIDNDLLYKSMQKPLLLKTSTQPSVMKVNPQVRVAPSQNVSGKTTSYALIQKGLQQPGVRRRLSRNPQQNTIYQQNLSQSKFNNVVRKATIANFATQVLSAKGITSITKKPFIEEGIYQMQHSQQHYTEYAIKLTFANSQIARAFSDAMGYGNKTKLFQQGSNVYIGKAAAVDFRYKVRNGAVTSKQIIASNLANVIAPSTKKGHQGNYVAPINNNCSRFRFKN